MSGADWDYGRGRPRQRYTETVEAATSLRKPAHRLINRLTQNCSHVFRRFAHNAMIGEIFQQATMSPGSSLIRGFFQLRLVRSLVNWPFVRGKLNLGDRERRPSWHRFIIVAPPPSLLRGEVHIGRLRTTGAAGSDVIWRRF